MVLDNDVGYPKIPAYEEPECYLAECPNCKKKYEVEFHEMEEKISARKWIAWIVSTIIVGGLVFLGFLGMLHFVIRFL